jgi:DNA modification methylase
MSDNNQEYIRLDSIKPLPANPKDHDVGTIVQSVERFGFAGTIVVNKTTGNTVRGNGRVEALRWLRVKNRPTPVKILEDIDNMWLVPVSYVTVTAQEEPALAIALNRAQELGGWDDHKLMSQLDDLVAQGKQMLVGIGFDADDLDQLRTRLDFNDIDGGIEAEVAVESLEEQEKLLETVQDKYNVQPGQIWQVANQWLMCNDSTKATSWHDLMQAAGRVSVQGIFTSPPYAKQREEYYDSVDPVDYSAWWGPVQAAAMMNLDTDGSFFINIKANVENGERLLYVMDLVTDMKRKWNWAYIDQFCWERPSPSGQWPNRFKNAWDSIYHFAPISNIKFYPDSIAKPTGGHSKGASNINTGEYFNMHNAFDWETARPSNRLPQFGQVQGWGHPAAFPPGLPQFFMLAYSLPGEAWLDPFLGSGSTLVAATDCNRIGLGIDITPAYIALSLERLARETGEEPNMIMQEAVP